MKDMKSWLLLISDDANRKLQIANGRHRINVTFSINPHTSNWNHLWYDCWTDFLPFRWTIIRSHFSDSTHPNLRVLCHFVAFEVSTKTKTNLKQFVALQSWNEQQSYHNAYFVRIKSNLWCILFVPHTIAVLSIAIYVAADLTTAFTAGRSIANTWMACVVWRGRILLKISCKTIISNYFISIDFLHSYSFVAVWRTQWDIDVLRWEKWQHTRHLATVPFIDTSIQIIIGRFCKWIKYEIIHRTNGHKYTVQLLCWLIVFRRFKVVAAVS